MSRYRKLIVALFGAGAVIATQYGYGGEYAKIATAVETVLTALGVYGIANDS